LAIPAVADQLGSWTVSPDNRHVAFSVDFAGAREFRIFVRTIQQITCKEGWAFSRHLLKDR